MNLDSYPTPETDAFGETPMPTLEHSGYADYVTAINHWIDHARDLERRLALCRDALSVVYNKGEGCEVFPPDEAGKPEYSWHERFIIVSEALTATAPK